MAAKKTATKTETAPGTATAVFQEVEKTGEALIKRVKQGFDVLSDKVLTTAKAAGTTAYDAAEAVADKVPKEQILDLLKEVEEIGEGVVRDVAKRLDSLKGTVTSAIRKAPKKKAVKKKAAKKKATKKKAVKKAAVKKTAKKKAPAKKTVKKKAAKKAAAKKASPKKAAKKKAIKTAR